MVKTISDLSDKQLMRMHSDLHKGYEWCMNTGKLWNGMEAEQVDALHGIAERTMRRRGMNVESSIHDDTRILDKGAIIHRAKVKAKVREETGK